ncbi:MAG: hypothetical protein HYZ53_16115 [Planctomycetes bacterium]|nr:hypothetical protein [Planctomycetota bacterium]
MGAFAEYLFFDYRHAEALVHRRRIVLLLAYLPAILVAWILYCAWRGL